MTLIRHNVYPRLSPAFCSFAGRQIQADFLNGTRSEWIYTDAGQIDWIKHWSPADGNGVRSPTLHLDYGYNPDGTIATINQIDATGSYLLTYEYDKRSRLTREWGAYPPVTVGGPSAQIDMNYSYDQVGNRLSKIDKASTPWLVTTYKYDVHAGDWQTRYATFNNRLMTYETRLGTGPGDPLIEACWFEYTLGGHVKRMTQHFPQGYEPKPGIEPDVTRDANKYYMTCMSYNIDQRLWLLRQMESEVGAACANLTKTSAREFRYDAGGRRRYLARERDPNTLEPLNNEWHEYVGSVIYADVAVDEQTGASVATRRYLHVVDGCLIGWKEDNSWHFVASDHLGSTRRVTGTDGSVENVIAFSCFGEPLANRNPTEPSRKTRYGYCGGWGYQNDALTNPTAGLGSLHIGSRYYAPGIGRFIQRDPTSIQAGICTYAYAYDSPLNWVDATGRVPAKVWAGILESAFVAGFVFGYNLAGGGPPSALGALLGGTATVWSKVLIDLMSKELETFGKNIASECQALEVMDKAPTIGKPAMVGLTSTVSFYCGVLAGVMATM